MKNYDGFFLVMLYGYRAWTNLGVGCDCRQEQQGEAKQPADKQPENSNNGEPYVKV